MTGGMSLAGARGVSKRHGAAFLPRVRQLHPAVTCVVPSGAADLQSVSDA